MSDLKRECCPECDCSLEEECCSGCPVCPSGEQVTNGDFETGDFTGWDVVLVPLIITTYKGITPYHGTYMAYLNSGVSISQDFDAEIPSECFNESSILEFYWTGFYGSCEGGTIIKVRLTYTDDTYTDLTDSNESRSWRCFDLKTYVESGKTLKTITISFDEEVAYVLVDYVRCIP